MCDYNTPEPPLATSQTLNYPGLPRQNQAPGFGAGVGLVWR